MDFFYDGQIRRYVTQFMRIFIGFKVQAGDGTLKSIPVMYGDMSRQVASIIKENSENKLPSVPRIACYITGLELDRNRLADASFVSKVSIRERNYTEFDSNGDPVYENRQGGNYTVERLMPTPFTLTMKADLWTSSTDQKLQLLEQILVLFNPSLEIQTTDNYIDWTSLSVVDLTTSNFSSRTIPQGTENDIDICSLEFSMPIFISPPVKVKKLGVVEKIIMNIFNDNGTVKPLSELVFNEAASQLISSGDNYGVLLLKANNGNPYDYNVSITSASEVIANERIVVDEGPIKLGARVDWNMILSRHEAYRPGISQIRFLQPNGQEIVGTFTINEVDTSFLVVTLFEDLIPSNTIIAGKTYVNAIINPQTFNPLTSFGSKANIPVGTRYLILEDIGNNANADGADAWKGTGNQDLVANANDIIEWDGSRWIIVFDSATHEDTVYIQNLRTGIQYRWDGSQWLKSFEGEYKSGYWSFELNP
jgi:hypothetical protein